MQYRENCLHTIAKKVRKKEGITEKKKSKPHAMTYETHRLVLDYFVEKERSTRYKSERSFSQSGGFPNCFKKGNMSYISICHIFHHQKKKRMTANFNEVSIGHYKIPSPVLLSRRFGTF